MSRHPLQRYCSLFLLLCALLVNSLPLQAEVLQPADKLQQSIDTTEAGNLPDKKAILENLQTALTWLKTRDEAQKRRTEYQAAIDNYPNLTSQLRQQLQQLQRSANSTSHTHNGAGLTTAELEQQILQTNSKLLGRRAICNKKAIKFRPSSIR